MTRRPARRARRTEVRCDRCRRHCKWLKLAGGWRLFDPLPINPHTWPGGGRAYPVEGVTAWRTEELVTELMGRRGCSATAAREEVYDMPWYIRHECPHPAPDERQESRR